MNGNERTIVMRGQENSRGKEARNECIIRTTELERELKSKKDLLYCGEKRGRALPWKKSYVHRIVVSVVCSAGVS